MLEGRNQAAIMPMSHDDPPLPAGPQPLNRDGYDAIAADWDAARTTLDAREAGWLLDLVRGLRPPAAVLDLGCGSGRPQAQWLLARGLQVTGVDQSARLLALARTRLPQGRWLEADIGGWIPDMDTDTDKHFAAVLVWDALFHLPRDQHVALLRRIFRLLQPAGRLLLTSGGSAQPAFTDTMHGARFFYDALPPDALLACLLDAGFHLERVEYLNPPTRGRDKGRIAVLAQRPAVRPTAAAGAVPHAAE